MAESRVQRIARWLLTGFFVAAGANHFVYPDAYRAMMPVVLPAPDLLVMVSGIAEIAGGLGLILPTTRRLAAWGLIALLIAVFPANIHMAIHRIPLGSRQLPDWVLWGRLPLQIALIAWVYWFARPPQRS